MYNIFIKSMKEEYEQVTTGLYELKI